MSAFALGYLLCQIPGGWLGNRFGTRLTFAALSIVWSLCNVGSAVASAFRVLWASRFALGIFQAGLVPVSAKIVGDWIPLRERGLSSALITSSMSIGGAFAMWLTGRLLDESYDWRVIFAAYSTVGIVWSVGFYWYFRTDPKDHSAVNRAELTLIHDVDTSDDTTTEMHEAATDATVDQAVNVEHVDIRPSSAPDSVKRGDSATSGGTLIANMLSSPAMWGICIQSFFRAAGYAFFVTWFFAFLEYAYGISKAQAGILNSLPLIGVVVGSLLGGVAVDWLLKVTGSRWISRSGTAIVSLTVCGILTMASVWTASATQLSIVIALGALFSGIGAPAAWAATIDIGGRNTAVVMGVMNMVGGLAGVILPTVLGSWFKEIRETDGDWNLVIYLHAAFYFVGALSWLMVNPNREV
ncbi:MAG: MFS transporter, partial [Planctomycetaceae bacterium]